jgi:hypothetical protein
MHFSIVDDEMRDIDLIGENENRNKRMIILRVAF